MKEIKIKLFRYGELSESVRREICEREKYLISDLLNECDFQQIRDTINEFEDIFNVKIHVHIDSCNYDYRIKFNTEQYADEITGKYLCRYVNNNIIDCLTKGKYYSCGNKVINGKYHYSKRNSKVIIETNGTCPLTGICWDEDILEEFWKWYDNRFRENISYKTLVYRCVDKFCKYCQETFEYNESFESIDDHISCNSNDWYLEDGTKFEGRIDIDAA